MFAPDSLKIEFDQEPVPKGRPRVNMSTRRLYTPPSTVKFENMVRELVVDFLYDKGYKNESDFPIYLKGIPLEIRIDFGMKRPKKLQRKKDPEGLMWLPSRFDIDNCTKSILDALNGIVWDDDRQIVILQAHKLYVTKEGMEPFVKMVISQVTDSPSLLTETEK